MLCCKNLMYLRECFDDNTPKCSAVSDVYLLAPKRHGCVYLYLYLISIFMFNTACCGEQCCLCIRLASESPLPPTEHRCTKNNPTGLLKHVWLLLALHRPEFEQFNNWLCCCFAPRNRPARLTRRQHCSLSFPSSDDVCIVFCNPLPWDPWMYRVAPDVCGPLHLCPSTTCVCAQICLFHIALLLMCFVIFRVNSCLAIRHWHDVHCHNFRIRVCIKTTVWSDYTSCDIDGVLTVIPFKVNFMAQIPAIVDKNVFNSGKFRQEG